MQTEGMFWRNTVRPSLIDYGRFERIETKTRDAFPDVIALVAGRTSLIELKSKKTLLDGLGTTVLQQHFLTSWYNAGGSAWLLAKVDKEIFFVRADRLERVLTREQWIGRSSVYSAGPRDRMDWGAVAWHLGTGR